MSIIEKLEEYVSSSKSVVLTIGSFDGVHKGHKALLDYAKTVISPQKNNTLIVITFSNHPSTVLRPSELPTERLITLPHKLKLLQEYGAQDIVLLPFTLDLAAESAASFIKTVFTHIPVSDLVLGYDAAFGKDRGGDPPTIKQLGKDLGFYVHYIAEQRHEEGPISSSRIRRAVKEGDFLKAASLLGRPYSIYAPIITGAGKGKSLGFPTINLRIEGLCSPPLGVYAVIYATNEKMYSGIANLGFAPTIKKEKHPVLEVHVLDELFMPQEHATDAYGEVFFKEFIRPEQRFASQEELATQIRKDIAVCSAIHNL